ncbi:MAG: hypothetical protein IPI45_07070 [Saprospiraceae bacterium]|mgnify:CR=1 FL=1|nr:hypothetical protein [Saprospiraceae bacterium]MBK7737522.1 hypothetical protein [Saprospiraceae bacterium]MBK7913895.1 hypothetical protein [Saprospiraceae bacterium]MBK8296849.1 hypothetical protein [Saprospiraceae bacterium]
MPNNVGQELLNVPFPEMVQKLALGIADAQTKLDLNSTKVAKFMADTKIKLPSIADPSQEVEFALIALGFFPGYYQFAESIIEVKMAITMATSTEAKIGVSASGGFGPFTASVNASYSSKYDYKVEGSSLLRVRLVPVPPPAMLQEYMEALIKKMSAPLEAEKDNQL